ncbi:MAG TPA: hypothetical protein VKQ11_06310 [Candidatus Sulfotelmatobacter sp.]|nr:hypothetical protein [Candidatus Sulfotelmatobacter sp.]
MRHCRRSIVSVSLILLLLSMLSGIGAGAAIVSPSSPAIEVAYLLVGSTVYTYDVDRTTGNPTEEGSGVTLDAISNPVLLPSANDHFIYVTGYDSGNVEWLWVYAADGTGVPQLPAVQALNLTDNGFSTYNFVISPDGTLAYAAESVYTPQYFLVAKISEFTVDPTTGMVTKSAQPAATYPVNGPCRLSAEAFFNVNGFNASGKGLYDSWGCNYPYANDSASYYKRSVNSSTGALGSEQQFFAWLDQNFGQDAVSIAPSELVYFSIPNNTSYGTSSVNVYSLSGQQQFSCTAAMLEACGYGLWNYVDPKGRFDLIEVAPDLVDITEIDAAGKKLVDTGNYLQGQFLAFAPDDALIYTQQVGQANPWVYPIYVFDPSTGGVSYTGGQIWDNTGGGGIIPALRR